MLQWIYTTSCWNRSLRSGWNTFSHSDGLTAAEVDELEQKCQIPAGLTKEDFPVFCSLTLSTGRHVICQSSYIGYSFYDGRPGATLTHAFIIEAHEKWPLSPVSYMGSSSFWVDLPEETKSLALYYREHRDQMVPPPYLPDLPLNTLIPVPDMCPFGIQGRLRNRDFALCVSRAISCFQSLRAEQLPLRFRARPSEYAPLLASLYYLLPEAFPTDSFSSLSCTDSGSARYSFFSVVGTKDNNYHIDLSNGDAGDGSLHPLVLSVGDDLFDWCDYIQRLGTYTPGQDDALFLFRLRRSSDTALLTSGDMQRLDEMMIDDNHSRLSKEILMTMARYVAFDFQGCSSLKVVERIFRLVTNPTFFALSDDGERVKLRELMRRMLISLAQAMASGSVSSGKIVQLLSSVSICRKLWLSDSMQKLLFDSVKDFDGVCGIASVSLTLSDGSEFAERVSPWEYGAMAERFYNFCEGSVESIARYYAAFSQPKRATLDFVRRSKAKPSGAALEGYLRYCAELSISSLRQCRMLLLENSLYSVAAETLFCTKKDVSDVNLLCECVEFAPKYPEYEEIVLSRLLCSSGSVSYGTQQGQLLLAAARKSRGNYLSSWQKYLMQGFPAQESVDDSLISLAREIIDLCEIDASCELFKLNYCRLLHQIAQTPNNGDLSPEIILPYFSPESDKYVDRKLREKVDSSMLCYLLSHTRRNELFEAWLDPVSFGWSAAALFGAIHSFCSDIIREKGKYCFDERGIAFLRAVMGIRDRLHFDDMDSILAPMFFSHVTSKETDILVRACPRHDEILKAYIRKHKETLTHRFLSLFTSK